MALPEYRSIDGSGNNQAHDDWGAAGTELLRLTFAHYEDDGFSIDDAGRPNPRFVSNTVAAQTDSIESSLGVSAAFVFWGQFLDHDLSLTPAASGEFASFRVPADDAHFPPGSELPFQRSNFDPSTGTDADNPREQVNVLTSFIDASQVYGSDPARAEFLRADGGKLKTSGQGFLPRNDGSQPELVADQPGSFVAGDVRANENPALTSLHTIFVREHNRLVDEIAQEHADYSDEQLYQEAKAIVEAQIQHITYTEFLPILLGPDALPAYQGYDPDVDPSVATEFSAAAFRLGHTLLPPILERVDEAGREIPQGGLALRDAFFRPPSELVATDIDPLLRGLAAGPAQEFDRHVVDAVRNFLINEDSGRGGFDLISLNVQRGRDHGLPTLNEAREALGLEAHDSFEDVSSDPRVQEALARAYDSVDEIDPWIGGVAEDPLAGAMVGEFFHAILVDQFTRARDGDRFFYEGRFDEAMLAEIRSTTLADIILRNTEIDAIQADVFHAYQRVIGDRGPDHLEGDAGSDLVAGRGGSDRLYGSAGDDELHGGAGGDRLVGGPGRDLLVGGADKDHFVLNARTSADTIELADVISDLGSGDTVRIGNISSDNVRLDRIDADQDHSRDDTAIRDTQSGGVVAAVLDSAPSAMQVLSGTGDLTEIVAAPVS